MEIMSCFPRTLDQLDKNGNLWNPLNHIPEYPRYIPQHSFHNIVQISYFAPGTGTTFPTSSPSAAPEASINSPLDTASVAAR